MKNLIIIFALLSSTALAQTEVDLTGSDNFSAQKKYSYSASYPLYLSSGKKFGYDQVEAAFDEAFAAKLPVVFFIHGRGAEPNKSLVEGTFVEGGAVRKLETQYKVKVLMFNWDSSAFLFDRSKPLSKMGAAADSLNKVLLQYKKYLTTHPKRPITLLAHSMGSIVLENYVNKYGWFPLEHSRVFSQIFLTSPDANNIKHDQWINLITKNENVFVSINQSDDILAKSNDSRPKGMMPLGYRPALPLASKATYLELTELGSKVGTDTGMHEVFNKVNMKGHVNFCRLFQTILTGQAVSLDSQNTVATAQPNYFKVKFQIAKNDKCFAF